MHFDQVPYFENEFFAGRYCHNPFGPDDQGVMTWHEADALCNELEERKEAGEEIKAKDAWFSYTPQDEVVKRSAQNKSDDQSKKLFGWPLLIATGLTITHFVYLIGGAIYANGGTRVLDHVEWGSVFTHEFIIFGVMWAILTGVRLIDRKS